MRRLDFPPTNESPKLGRFSAGSLIFKSSKLRRLDFPPTNESPKMGEFSGGSLISQSSKLRRSDFSPTNEIVPIWMDIQEVAYCANQNATGESGTENENMNKYLIV